MADTLTVLCRLPSGIRLELHDLAALKSRAKSQAPIMAPARALSSVTLNGIKHDPLYHPAENRMLGRAGRTTVSAEFWNAWLEQNAHTDLVTQKLVFAESTPSRANSAMAELAQSRTGLEGTDHTTMTNGVTPLEKAG